MNRKTTKRAVRRSALAAAAAVLGLMSADFARAQSPSTPVAPPSAKALGKVVRVVKVPRVAVLPSGSTVTIDPVTKRIRPGTPEDLGTLLAAEAARVAVENEEITVFLYENGAKAARLPDSFMQTLVATRQPDGTIAFECASDRDRQARAELPAGAVVPAPTPTTIPALEEK